MRIECPSCNYFAEVNNEKVPPMRGDTKCPRCSAVFFVAPTEPETPEIPSALLNCPKCNFEQEPSETCVNCGVIYAKHKTAARSVTKVAPFVERREIGQETHDSSNQPKPFDTFQRVLLACGFVATLYSLKRGIDLMALEEKFREKYHLIPSKMGFLNRAYSCVLPSIGIAEFILLVLIVYSYKKRKLLSQYGNLGLINRAEVKNTIWNTALFLMVFTVIAGIATTFEHDEGAMAVFLCIFIGLLLLVPLFICYLLKKISNNLVIWLLTAVAIAVEVGSFITLKPIILFARHTLLWLHDLQVQFWRTTPLIVLVFLFMELYLTLKDLRLKKALASTPSRD